MPTPLELSNRLHTAQLTTVSKAQDLTVLTVGRLAALKGKAPKAPARVARFTEPFTSQLATYRQDWIGVTRSFSERLNEAVQNGTDGSQPITRPTVVKKSTAKKA
jgi:hypothetical protein